jgi:hypothetical protein
MTEDYVLVATFDWPEHAEEVLARLQDEGIPARLTRTPATAETPEEIRLEVVASHAEHVDRLLADAGGAPVPAETGPSWACPSCGWPVSVERITCPRCQAMRSPSAEPAPPPPAPTNVLAETSDLAPQPGGPFRRKPHRLADLDRGDYSIMEALVATWLLGGMAALAWMASQVRWIGFVVPTVALMGVSVWRVRELALERADAAKKSSCLGWGLLLVHLVSLFVGLIVVTGLLGLRKPLF